MRIKNGPWSPKTPLLRTDGEWGFVFSGIKWKPLAVFLASLGFSLQREILYKYSALVVQYEFYAAAAVRNEPVSPRCHFLTEDFHGLRAVPYTPQRGDFR